MLTSQSEKMYKSRINEWGLHKNQKRSRKWTVVRNSKHPRDQERPHTHRLQTQVTDPKDVHRYWEHRGARTGWVIAQQTELHTPEAVGYFNATRPLSIMLEPMTKTERILINIRDYFTGSFEAGIWQSTDPRVNCESTKGQGNAMIHLRALSQQCITACRLLRNNRFQKAGQTLISATSKIKEIVSAEDPMTLTYLFAVVAHVHRQSRHEIALAILRQFSALAEILMGERHPLHCICALLVTIHPSLFGEVISKCSVSTGDHFESLIDPLCRSALASRGVHIREVDINRAIAHKICMLQNLLSKCEAAVGYFDVRTFEIRLVLAFHHLENADYPEAVEMGRSLLASYLQLWTQEANSYTGGLWAIPSFHHNFAHRSPLEIYLRDLCMLGWGPRDGRATKWLDLLECWSLRRRHLMPEWMEAFYNSIVS